MWTVTVILIRKVQNAIVIGRFDVALGLITTDRDLMTVTLSLVLVRLRTKTDVALVLVYVSLALAQFNRGSVGAETLPTNLINEKA